MFFCSFFLIFGAEVDNGNAILDFVIPSPDDGFMRSSSKKERIYHKISEDIDTVDLSLVLKLKLSQHCGDQMEKKGRRLVKKP